MSNSPKKKKKYIHTINAAGQKGSRGADAVHYKLRSYRPWNHKGSVSGYPGDPGEKGEEGNHVFISLYMWQKDLDIKTAKSLPVKLKTYQYSEERLSSTNEFFLELKIGDKIKIETNGGNGGNGGFGGNGLNSSSALKTVGNGGRGGNGGNGGNAGNVQIEVPEHQSYLLSYFYIESYGGKGGVGGKGGERGLYTLDYNKRANSKSGEQGETGREGESGSIDFILLDQSGQKIDAYKDLFALKIEDISLKDTFPDGIFEFGEEIQVKFIRIQNIGPMPTPIGNPIRLRIKENPWLIVEPVYIEIPEGIPARIRKHLFNPFTIQIKELSPTQLREFPSIRNIELGLEAFLPGTDMVFPLADFKQEIPIQYPLKLSEFGALQSLIPGEKGKISWKTRNLSELEPEVQELFSRIKQTRIKLGNTDTITRNEYIDLLDKETHQPIAFNFQIYEIEENKPFQEEDCYLQIPPDATGFEDVSVEFLLELGQLNYPQFALPIQQLPLRIRITKAYQKTPESDVLVVFHSGIDIESLQEVEKYYEAIGSKIDYWDLSYYGFLDLEKKLANGNCLLEDFEGKTLLLLNFPYRNIQAEYVLPALFLKQEQFHRAVNEFGIEFLLVGETEWETGSFIQWINLPTSPRKIYNRYRTIDEFRAFLSTRLQEGIDGRQGFLHRPLGTLAYPEDNVSNRSYELLIQKADLEARGFFQAGKGTFQSICEELAREMEERFPREQFFFIYEYFQNDPEGNLGKIEVKQGPHKIHGANMLAWNLKRSIYEEAHDTSTPSVGFFLYLSLSNWEFKEMLQEFLLGKPGFLETEQAIDDARDALMYRIVVEFMNLKSFHSFSKDELRNQLGFFNMVFDFNIGHLDINSPQTRLFAVLCFHVLAFIKSQKSQQEKLFLNHDEYRLTRLIQEMLRDWMDLNFDTSRELKKLDKKLWKRNRVEGKLFKELIREKRSRQELKLKSLASSQRISVALAARNLYLKDVQSISVQYNAIYSRQVFDKIANRWRKVAEKYAEIEKEEVKLIEKLKHS